MKTKLILIFLTLFILGGNVYASKYIHLEFNDPLGEPSIEKIRVIESTFFYRDYFMSGWKPNTSDYTIKFFNKEGKLIRTELLFPETNSNYEYEESITKIIIYKNQVAFIEKDIEFCNYNDVCEPCRGGNCKLIENVLACSDCESGIGDYYCDLFRDGICDPDCEGEDVDCEGCKECYFREQESLITECLRDYYGEICTINEKCTGRFVTASDSGSSCCVEGKCEDLVSSPDVPEGILWKDYVLEIVITIVLICMIIFMFNIIGKKKFVKTRKK